jgi:DNA-binding transcriptional LysR family regulator
MDLNWLEDLVAVAEEESFSKAAKRRHVTQPALSRRIRALEEWLGTPLFERTTHTLALTPACETFRPIAEDVLRRLVMGRQEALEVARLRAETIYFAATHALSQTFFPKWIHQVQSASATAAVQLVAVNFAGCEQMLLDGKVQFILAHYHPGLMTGLDCDQFQRIELGTDVLIPVSAPSMSSRRPRRPADPCFKLPGAPNNPLPYLTYHPGSGVGRIVASFLEASEQPACLAPSFSAPVMLLIDMARKGRGVTWAPRSLIRGDLATHRLVPAGGKDWEFAISICLFRSRARSTKAAETFWSAAKKIETALE